MMFTTDLLCCLLIALVLVSFLATDAMLLANEISRRNAEFLKQKKAFDASEYLLWELAPVDENALQHHRIDAGRLDCGAVKKEPLMENISWSIESLGITCGSLNKTIVKRIVLCDNSFGGNDVCILEVGA